MALVNSQTVVMLTSKTFYFDVNSIFVSFHQAEEEVTYSNVKYERKTNAKVSYIFYLHPKTIYTLIIEKRNR